MSFTLEEAVDTPWLEYRTADDVAYYFNSATSETTWYSFQNMLSIIHSLHCTRDVPEEFKKWKCSTIDQYLKKSALTWRRYAHEDGRDYYYDKSTKVTQWTPPEIIVKFEKDLIAFMIEKYSAAYHQSSTAMDTSNWNEVAHTETVVDDVPVTKKAKIEENNLKENIKIDKVIDVSSAHTATSTVVPTEMKETITATAPTKTRHDLLLDELSKPDSVFEPNSLSVLKELMELNVDTCTIDTCTIAKTLAKAYVGRSQVIPILLAWSELAKRLQDKPAATDTSSDDSGKLVRKMCNDELSLLIKQRFNKERADIILFKIDSNAMDDVDNLEWVENMLEEAVFRKVFIHLYNANITSKFLCAVISMISDKGFNNELAHGLNHVDNFVVYSRIVNDSVARILTANDSDVGPIISNIQRITYQNEFYFIYITSLLDHLMQKMKASRTGTELHSFVRVKDSAPLQQEDLFGDDDAENLVYYNASTYLNAHSMLKRFYQELIYHRNSTMYNEVFALQIVGAYNGRSNSSTRPDKLIMYELYDVVKSNGISIIQCQKLSAFYSDISNLEHAGLLQDEIVLNALMDIFIHPGKAFTITTTAASSLVSKLIAIACIDTTALSDPHLLFVFENDLIAAKQHCTGIISDINLSFDDPKISGLTSLICKHRVVSIMVIRWVSYYVHDHSFLTMTTKFYYPIFYHFLVVSIDEHPLHHPEIFPILKKITLISSADSSIGCIDIDIDKFTKETMSNELVVIQKDAIDCMVYLFGRGYVNVTLDFLMESARHLKTALLLYLVNAVVMAVAAPLSKSFSERYLKFLADSNILAVIANKDFNAHNLVRINTILEYCHLHYQVEDHLEYYRTIKRVLDSMGN